MIHLPENTRKKFGKARIGYVRNQGMRQATGDYIAFLDDDDIWFPQKLERQLEAMTQTGCGMCSTDGLYGNGTYSPDKSYPKYNAGVYYATLQKIYRNHNSQYLANGFPRIWTWNFLNLHNCCITSSVIARTDLLKKIGYMSDEKTPGEDYDCWLRLLKHTDSVYLGAVCFYYDGNHGDGRNY